MPCGEYTIIKDVGPWDQYMTVTNNVENVVAELHERGFLPEGHRLFYFDSENNLDEIVVKNGKFVEFKPFRDVMP